MGIKRIYIVLFEFFIIIYGLIKSRVNNYLLLINLSTIFVLIFSFNTTFSRPYYVILSHLVIINLGFLMSENIKLNKILFLAISFFIFNLFIGNIYYLQTYPSSISIKEMRELNKYIDENKIIGGFNSAWFINPSLEWIHQNRPYIREDEPYSKLYNDIEMPKEEFYWLNHKGTSIYYESINPEDNIIPFNQIDFSNKKLIHTIQVKPKKGKVNLDSNNEKIELWKINP